jgi:CBS domain-containing protein
MDMQVSHPILRLHVLSREGTYSASDRVFCRYRHASVPVEECVNCIRCDAIRAGSAPTVDCTIPDAPPGAEVGTLLCTGATVLEQSAPLRDALRLLHNENRHSIAVVDDDKRLVGIVHEMAFVRPPAPRRADEDVTVAMSTAIALHERTPVRIALRLLASSHLREATVVSSDGTPLGIFRDVDGLHWIARARAFATGDQA